MVQDPGATEKVTGSPATGPPDRLRTTIAGAVPAAVPTITAWSPPVAGATTPSAVFTAVPSASVTAVADESVPPPPLIVKVTVLPGTPTPRRSVSFTRTTPGSVAP